MEQEPKEKQAVCSSAPVSGYATADAVDLAQWHDVVMSAMGSLGVVDETKLTPANLAETYQLLPDSLKAIADEWSLSDTVFRDEAHEWLVAHLGKSHNRCIPAPASDSDKDATKTDSGGVQ